MKKEYSKPIIETKQFELNTTVADLTPSGLLGGVGTATGGGSVNWEDA